MKTYEIELELTEEMLGTLPNDQDIYRSYIASKAPDASTIEDEIEAVGVDDVVEKGITVFARDKDGNPCIYDYLIKGFFKNACKAMRESTDSKSKDLKAYKTKIDNLVFVEPRMIPIQINGELGICSRPLRASTAQGDRVAISSSESVSAGSKLSFKVTILDDSFEKFLMEWLDYGKFNGLGQWHNSGKGRFTYIIK